MRKLLAIAVGLLGGGCGSYAAPQEEHVGEATSELMTDEPSQKIDGYNGVVWLSNPGGGMCTGWMLNETVVVTAAHCVVDAQGGAITGYTIDYMRPGFGRDRLLNSSDVVEVRASPFYSGGTTVADFFSNPLHPSENNAKHDLGFIRTSSRWKNTRYSDYLRVYDDLMSTLTSVYVYGVGNIFRTVSATDPEDKLRFSHFQVDPNALSSDLVIWTYAGETERLCAGDSGGPYMKKIDGLDLVAGGHHGTDRSSSDFCPKPGGTQWGEKLTWSGSDDLDWLRSSVNASCSSYAPSGQGNNYVRCFELSFISDAPDREQRYGSKQAAVGIAIAFL